MKKRLVLLLAAVALALPLGASVATATPGDSGPDRSGDTGAACPENSPQGADEDPSCGHEGNGGGGGGGGGENGGGGNGGGNGGGGNGNACPPNSPDTDGDGEPDCGNNGGGGGGSNTCADGIDNDGDGENDAADLNDCQDGDTTEDTEDPDPANTCTDGLDNDGDEETDSADLNDCQGDDTTEDTGDPAGGAENFCTADTADPGILTEDTLGQTLWDAGLSAASPLVEDPEADGAISGQIYAGGNGTPAEPLSDEIACAVDLLIDPVTGLPDL